MGFFLGVLLTITICLISSGNTKKALYSRAIDNNAGSYVIDKDTGEAAFRWNDERKEQK